MKLTFLGTSAATAMPLPFCGCAVCRRARQNGGRDIRKRAALVIDEKILIDLGPDSVAACGQYGVDLTKIHTLLQTHAHSDHFDAGHLITRHPDYAVEDPAPLTVAASGGTLRAMNEALRREDGNADLFNDDFRRRLGLILSPIRPGETASFGGYTVTAFDSRHDPVQQALVYLVEREGRSVFYGTDLLEMSDEIHTRLAVMQPDVIILDQTYGEGRNAGGHMDAGMVKEAVRKLRETGAVTAGTRVYATHISHEGNPSHEEMCRLAGQYGYTAAYDGLIVSV